MTRNKQTKHIMLWNISAASYWNHTSQEPINWITTNPKTRSFPKQHELENYILMVVHRWSKQRYSVKVHRSFSFFLYCADHWIWKRQTIQMLFDNDQSDTLKSFSLTWTSRKTDGTSVEEISHRNYNLLVHWTSVDLFPKLRIRKTHHDCCE